MGILAHLAGRFFKTLFGMFFAGLIFAALGAGGVLGVAFAVTHQWPPQPLTIAAAIAIGGLAAYAAALTVLLRAILNAGKTIERDIVGAAERELTGAKH